MTVYSLIVVLIVTTGIALAALAYGWPRRGSDLLLLSGAGTIAGLLLAGIVAGAVVATDIASLWWRCAIVMLLVAAGAVLLARRWRQAVPVVDPPLPPRRAWWLIAVILVLIALRLLPLLDEVLLRPVYPWDAWSVWMVKPKAWFLSGEYHAFVDAKAWFAGAEALRTLPAAGYPELSSHLQLLLAVAAGEWNEPLLLLPWFLLFIAMLLAFTGAGIRLGCPPVACVIVTYLLASLPLLNAQIALAGYLDLWVAAVLMLALSSWLLWRRERRWPLLLATFALAICLVLLKREGLVWCCLLLALVGYDRLSSPWRRRVLWTAFAVVAMLVFMAVGFGGWIDERLGHLAVPGVRSLSLGWRSGGLVLVSALFVHANWHLLALLLVAVPLLRWRVLREDAEARLLGLFVLAAWVALLMLFCLTPASEWAMRQTATNRLVLQLVPTMLLWLMLLVRDVRWTLAIDPPGTAT